MNNKLWWVVASWVLISLGVYWFFQPSLNEKPHPEARSEALQNPSDLVVSRNSSLQPIPEDQLQEVPETHQRSLLVSMASCDSSSMSYFDTQRYNDWQNSTSENSLREKLKSSSSLNLEANLIRSIQDPGTRLFNLSVFLDYCSANMITPSAELINSPEAKKCRDAIGEDYVSKREAFEVLQDAAQLGNFEALLKLADYKPAGFEDIIPEARMKLAQTTLAITQPAYQKLVEQIPSRNLRPKELETIGWISVKNGIYAQLSDPLADYSGEENEGLAILLAARTMQPTQFIPQSRACFYLDQRLGQKSAFEAIQIEKMAEKLIDDWLLQDKTKNKP